MTHGEDPLLSSARQDKHLPMAGQACAGRMMEVGPTKSNLLYLTVFIFVLSLILKSPTLEAEKLGFAKCQPPKPP